MSIQLTIASPETVRTSAKQLLEVLDGRKKIAFQGEMGSGKTTLIQALCAELGVDQVVTSPTFALINEYFTADGDPVFHFDLYRIEDISELYDIGYEDYFYSKDICFIEWPEKAENLMPEETVKVIIKRNEDNSRTVELKI